ncbi:purple acid phosphatase family protein [Microbacterium album]|uniref:Uncharacterized protein n=1 Tax=Microbacterium album TaxID=2053191 RepID=A0A917IJY8_9MICO|nr:metallophosphoesterase family protein [Microbacterium album]GGH51731.1 hypothetical protein GCM10010921_31270 [Microbacterium album]
MTAHPLSGSPVPRRPRGRVALAFAVAVCATIGSVGLTASAAFAADTPYPAAQRYAITPVPDRITLIPTEDPATSQRVTWRADSATPRAQIVEAPAAFGDVQRSNAAAYDVIEVEAAFTEEVDPKTGYVNRYHTAEFTGLKPNTRYSYRVGDATQPVTSGSGASSINNWSPWMDFTTAADGLEPYSFIYFGDAQNYIDSAVPRVFQQAVKDRPDARILLHAGDLMNQTGTTDSSLRIQEKEWAEWYAAAGYSNQQRNVIATPGNHEYNSSTSISPFWKPQFPFPSNGPALADGTPMPEVERSAYYVDYQGVRYISLDSSPLQNGPVQEHVRAAQKEWLEQVLTDPERPKWTVVTYHHPAFAGTGTRNNSLVRADWTPLFDKYGVDLVLQGHDHVYNRGNLITDDDPNDPTKSHGTVYSISVSGGKMYSLNQGQNWTNNGANLRVNGQNIQLYQLIDVSEGSLLYQARLATGEFYDGYRVDKPGNGWNSPKIVTDLTDDPDTGNNPQQPEEPEEPAKDLNVSVNASTRVMAGMQYVSVATVNNDTVAVDMVIETPYGSKSFTAVQPGRAANVLLNSRQTSIPAGEVKVRVTGVVDGESVEVEKTAGYPAVG